MPITAVVMAAGEGTRMKSSHPKVMHKMLDKPLVWWALKHAKEAGATRLVCVVGNGAQEVRGYLEGCSEFFEDDCELIFVEQTERLGTGHAVRVAAEALGGFAGPTLVLNGDTPLVRPQTLTMLVEATQTAHNACTVLTMEPPDPFGYGRVLRDENNKITCIVEEKEATPTQRAVRECNSGMYCFCGRRLTSGLSKITNNNAKGEYYLTDLVDIYRSEGEPVGALLCEDFEETLGVNSRVQLAEATRIMQARINHAHMEAGVTMLDPTQVWIGPCASIGKDTVLMPQTFIWGNSVIGEACEVGPNSRVENSHVGNNCVVDETILQDSIIDDEVKCGPRAYLRGGAHLCRGAKAGTHVELKKSTVGAGSKVPHLSYIGDCTMGEGVNIGGGTITCNYDGINKHPTTIGDRVFIGSDTMLVAPVTIGDDACVGASSCITQDVPAGSLGIERSKQVVVEGFMAKHQERLKKGNA